MGESEEEEEVAEKGRRRQRPPKGEGLRGHQGDTWAPGPSGAGLAPGGSGGAGDRLVAQCPRWGHGEQAVSPAHLLAPAAKAFISCFQAASHQGRDLAT